MDDYPDDLEPYVSFNVSVEQVCTITFTGEFLPELVFSIAQHTAVEDKRHGPLRGILLDLRRAERISIIRLSGLLDQLSRFDVPIAVVLHATHQQQRLIDLFHQTLAGRDRIAYFADLPEALAHLEANAP